MVLPLAPRPLRLAYSAPCSLRFAFPFIRSSSARSWSIRRQLHRDIGLPSESLANCESHGLYIDYSKFITRDSRSPDSVESLLSIGSYTRSVYIIDSNSWGSCTFGLTSCQSVFVQVRFQNGGVALGVDLRYVSSDEQHREESSMAKLLRLSLATLTFLVFFYSTTLITSYFYPLDWAPIAF